MLLYSIPVVVSLESSSLVIKSIVTKLYSCSITNSSQRSLQGLCLANLLRLQRLYTQTMSLTFFLSPRKLQYYLSLATILVIPIYLLSLDLQISIIRAVCFNLLMQALLLKIRRSPIQQTPLLDLLQLLYSPRDYQCCSAQSLSVAQQPFSSLSLQNTIAYSLFSCYIQYSKLSSYISKSSRDLNLPTLAKQLACLLKASALAFSIPFLYLISR